MAPVERCTNHTFEIADRLCGDCGRPFCGMCLVKPFKRRPPLCHQCAVAAAGVRKSARSAPVRTKREIKAFEKERRQSEVRSEAAAAPDGGFGPAKPALSSSSNRPAPRATTPTPKPAAPAKDAEGEGEGEEQQETVGRNRPLRGLAR